MTEGVGEVNKKMRKTKDSRNPLKLNELCGAGGSTSLSR